MTAEEYFAAVPEAAKSKVAELREIVQQLLPESHEVVSYGVVGYKSDPKKRAVVFISGWKDHVAIYPVPSVEDLRIELAPYIRGKGTLWFPLDKPLPIKLIARTVQALAV